MQGGFIKGLKKIYKSVKHEFKGADIHNLDLENLKAKIIENDFKINNNIYINNSSFRSSVDILRKDFSFYNNIIYTLNYNFENVYVKAKELGINNLNIYNSMEIIVPYRIVYEFLDIKSITKVNEFNYKFENIISDLEIHNDNKVDVFQKDLYVEKSTIKEKKKEEFEIPKIINKSLPKLKSKIKNGDKLLLKIPYRIKGKYNLSNDEIINLAKRVKMDNPDINFALYQIEAVFDNFLDDYRENHEYIKSDKSILINFNKLPKAENKTSKLILLRTRKDRRLKKIFI